MTWEYYSQSKLEIKYILNEKMSTFIILLHMYIMLYWEDNMLIQILAYFRYAYKLYTD